MADSLLLAGTGASAGMPSPRRLNGVAWLICVIAAIGFAFDIYELLMLPLIAGIAYEFIRFASTNMDNPTVRTIVAPNLFFQRLTTREPSLEMLEVAIRAFERVQAGVQDMETTPYSASEAHTQQSR